MMMDGSLEADMKTPSSYEYNVDVTSAVAMAHACGVLGKRAGCLGSPETGGLKQMVLKKVSYHMSSYSLTLIRLRTLPDWC